MNLYNVLRKKRSEVSASLSCYLYFYLNLYFFLNKNKNKIKNNIRKIKTSQRIFYFVIIQIH